jgi:hypothetical protein
MTSKRGSGRLARCECGTNRPAGVAARVYGLFVRVSTPAGGSSHGMGQPLIQTAPTSSQACARLVSTIKRNMPSAFITFACTPPQASGQLPENRSPRGSGLG